MFCTQCGQQVSDHDNFCTYCGAKLVKPIFSAPVSSPKKSKAQKEPKLTYAEKELAAVRLTKLQDMYRYNGNPYVWNGRLETVIQPNTHPFAYIDLSRTNIKTAQAELQRMNCLIEQSKMLCKRIPQSLHIPIEQIVFQPSFDHGYTRLICSPVTYSGELSQKPFSLSFMTNLSKNDTTHGELYYNQSCNIEAADIYFWRRGNGYFFYYETVNNTLVLSKVEYTNAGFDKTIIYKAPHILAWEAKLKAEEKDFEWLQTRLPDKCPKSITGFRRMKTQHTKNYQALQQAAAELGRKI